MTKTTNENAPVETYFVGKRDFSSYFVTVCRNGHAPKRIDGFSDAEQARAWVRQRLATIRQAGAGDNSMPPLNR